MRRKKARGRIAEKDDTFADACVTHLCMFRAVATGHLRRERPVASSTQTQVEGGSQSATVKVAESIMALLEGSLSNWCSSEEKLQANLNLSRRGGSTDPSEACGAGICGRIVQIHIVERVEKLEAELQGLAFRD